MNAITISKTEQANEAHGRIMSALSSTVHDAIAIGKYLTVQKSTLKHGEWLSWISANLTFDRRTATNYMRLFEKRDRLKWETISHLTDAYRQLFPKVSREASARPEPRPTSEAPRASDRRSESAGATYNDTKVTLDLTTTEKRVMTLALHSTTPFKEASAAWTKLLLLLRKRGVNFNGDY